MPIYRDTMRRLSVLAAAVVAAAALPAAADAKPKLTCHSGTTVLQQGRTRLFLVRHPRVWWVCSSALRTPRYVSDLDPEWGGKGLYRPRVFGVHLGYLSGWNDASTSGTVIGWVDLQTGRNASVELLSDDPLGATWQYADTQGYVVGADGSVAALLSTMDGSQGIAFMAYARRTLAAPRILATAPAGTIDPRSLAFGDATISWTTTAGAPGSAPITAG